jgi:hypothetical protein
MDAGFGVFTDEYNEAFAVVTTCFLAMEIHILLCSFICDNYADFGEYLEKAKQGEG